MDTNILLQISDIVTQATSTSTTFTDKGAALIGAGIAMVGAAGVGAGQGYVAGRACDSIARNPEVESKIRTFLIIGSAISESSAIYGLIVSFILMFVV
ncbi:ATP synthase F0 subunit C [Mycoplasmoides pirum]|uniref:ATP synthase F0 subunit C n=1 Tax=Mycoplasmoides pirum TaxID=2122 RepID=UPI0004882967|nr:ATP synthase F0 subunit C [Mycoplasmoides pirum]